MTWSEIRATYPEQWLVIEALQAHTDTTQMRQLDKIAVIERCQDGGSAMNRYRALHRQFPEREFYFVHTSRSELQIRERQWFIGNGLPDKSRRNDRSPHTIDHI
jgi:hypothetical protein